jgi:hypothetical protein
MKPHLPEGRGIFKLHWHPGEVRGRPRNPTPHGNLTQTLKPLDQVAAEADG